MRKLDYVQAMFVPMESSSVIVPIHRNASMVKRWILVCNSLILTHQFHICVTHCRSRPLRWLQVSIHITKSKLLSKIHFIPVNSFLWSHCPEGEDEELELCSNYKCPSDRFNCYRSFPTRCLSGKHSIFSKLYWSHIYNVYCRWSQMQPPWVSIHLRMICRISHRVSMKGIARTLRTRKIVHLRYVVQTNLTVTALIKCVLKVMYILQWYD